MNVLIAEDEALAAERLAAMLTEYDNKIRLVATVDSVSDAVKVLGDHPELDLLFLDIQLADGKSFEIFNEIRTDVPIIFITAYDEYALKAFKNYTIDYLLKPLQRHELFAALDKFKRMEKKQSANIAWHELKEIIAQAKTNFKQRLILKIGNKLQFKNPEDVAYFFADGKDAYLVTKKENRKYLIGHTLEELEQLLDPKDFFRISRKYIVRADAIAEVKGLISTKLIVCLNQPAEHELLVSRERCQEFKQWLDQ